MSNVRTINLKTACRALERSQGDPVETGVSPVTDDGLAQRPERSVPDRCDPSCVLSVFPV